MSSRVIYVLGNYVAISFFYRLYEVIRSSLGRDCHSQLEYKFPSQRRASSFEIATSEYLPRFAKLQRGLSRLCALPRWTSRKDETWTSQRRNILFGKMSRKKISKAGVESKQAFKFLISGGRNEHN